MFRFFENLVNPFAPYDESTPPKALWPYLRSHYGPFKKLMFFMACTGGLVALVETGLIFYTGHVIDLMNEAGADAFWGKHGVELILATLFIIILRPLVIALNKLLLEQGFTGNMQA